MVAAVRKEDHALFGAQYTRPTAIEVTQTAMTEYDGVLWCDHPGALRARRGQRFRH